MISSWCYYTEKKVNTTVMPSTVGIYSGSDVPIKAPDAVNVATFGLRYLYDGYTYRPSFAMTVWAWAG